MIGSYPDGPPGRDRPGKGDVSPRSRRLTVKKYLAVLLSFVFVLALAGPLTAQEAAGPAPLKVGDNLPDDLMIKDLDGKSIKVKDALTGATFTFFQFMTTACSACQAELQEFISMQSEMGKDKIGIVAISMDLLGADAVKAYESKFNYGVDYLLDPEFTLPTRFNFAYTPSFFVVDQGGKIVFMKGGFMQSRWAKDRERLEAAMK
jgi:peroxiredoxin